MQYNFGEWTLDTQRVELSRAGHVRPLRRKAFQVLAYLLAHPDRVVAKQELCAQVWPQQFISDAALESAIKAVRQAIGDSGRDQRLLQTVYGQGYRLIVPVAARPVPSPADEGMAPPREPPAALPVPDIAAADHPLAPVARAAPPDEPVPAGVTRAPLPGAPDVERRQLTVLVCTLRAEPPLARPLDPDELYAVLSAYQETCARIIRGFEGQIAQYRGEELVVYFGAPQAHDDDPQRAVRAGLRLVDAMREFPPHLARQDDIRWAIRVGVDTGLVVVGALSDGGPHARWVLGDTPTLAAQIHERAAPDTVVISAATQRLIHGYFLCHPLETQPGQGLTTALQAYRVVRESEAQHRLDVMTASGITPFVGREHEVGLLVACWVQAQEGRGRVAVIQGEAGIGKSRLVRVLHEHLAAEPHTAIMWRGAPTDQQSALHPVLRYLQHLVRGCPEYPPAAILQRLEEVLASSSLALPAVVPLFAALLALPLPARYPPLQVTPQRHRQQTLDALLTWLLAEATRHPVLFIVEDLHWLDPSTLEFLRLLIDQVPTARLLLVLTCRPEFHPPWGFRAHLTSVTLDRLSPTQAAMMVQWVAGQALPPAVQQHLVTHTDGVPLFIEEVTKLVLESGPLQAPADHDALPGPLPALAIPATLHDALMARLDCLGPSKAVAQLGAVLGRTFAYDVLHAVAPWEETTLQHGLRQLVEAELVYQQGVPPQATYRFKHALIQDTAYQSLLRSTRQQYHQRIAQVLETRFPEVAATQPELLAYHCTKAGLREQALPYWQRAGQQASDRSAHVEAISHFTTGIELLKLLPETPERTQHALTLHIALGMALQMTKGLAAPEVEHAYTQAYALCQHVGETPELFQVLLGLWRFYLLRPQLHMARELGETLVRLAQQTDDPALAIIAHYALGMTWFYLGALPAAHLHLEEAISRYTPDQRRVLVSRFGFEPGIICRGFSAWTLWCLGYPAQALTRLHTALAWAHELSHPYSLAYTRWVVAMAYQFRRDVSPVYEHAEATVTLATAQGFTQWVALGTSLRGWALAMQGQGEEGMTEARQGLTVYRATGAALFVPYLSTLRADISGHLGHTADGLQTLAEAHTLMQQQEERWWEAEIARLRGVLLLRQRGTSQAEAEPWLRRALGTARRQQAKSLELRAAMSMARLWHRQGKCIEARALLAPVYGWFTEGFDTADLQDAKALLDALA